jgi:hypothetical protein
MRNTQNSRQRLLPAEIPGEARRKRERNEIEQTILKLQKRCVKNAEQIEIQSEKEAFYDMEILRLTKMVEAARLQKPQHKLNLPDQQHGDQNSREEPKAKQIDESSLGQVGLIAKVSRANHGINEAKANNTCLRETLNHLRYALANSREKRGLSLTSCSLR